MPIQEQFVPVSVPETMLADVLELIAQGLRAGASDGAEAEAIAMDEALVRRMYEESYEAHQQLMEFLATRPGEWVYTSEIVEALKPASGNQSVAGWLGAFGRRAAFRYDGHKPWASEWDPAAGESKHKMAPWVADVIKALQ